ncbi:MAG: hypothetical protein LBH74_04475 [Nitrososphaerota archaeon]|jgi:hypothetical protein|nr:hypothetical protein [Nitrososphaerota archaeon]
MSFSAVQLILVSIITLAATTHNLYYRYAINIFKRKITVTYSAKNESELVYSLALGLYSVVITVLVFTSAFILLRVWGLSSVVTVGLILIEIALFGGLGYVGVVQLRKNMEWVQTQDQ